MSSLCQVGVIGGGAWGTALSAHLARKGHDTLIWAREAEVVAGINDASTKENAVFLKVQNSIGILHWANTAGQSPSQAHWRPEHLSYQDLPVYLVNFHAMGAQPSNLDAPCHVMPSCTKGVRLPEALRATDSLDAVVSHAAVLVMVVPTPFVASTMANIKDKLQPDQVLSTS